MTSIKAVDPGHRQQRARIGNSFRVLLVLEAQHGIIGEADLMLVVHSEEEAVTPQLYNRCEQTVLEQVRRADH